MLDLEEKYIGKRIKNMAIMFYQIAMVFIVIIGIGSFIVGMALFFNGFEAIGLSIVILGVIIVSLLAFFLWMTHILILGFGQLVDLTEKNNKLLKLMALSENE